MTVTTTIHFDVADHPIVRKLDSDLYALRFDGPLSHSEVLTSHAGLVSLHDTLGFALGHMWEAESFAPANSLLTPEPDALAEKYGRKQ